MALLSLGTCGWGVTKWWWGEDGQGSILCSIGSPRAGRVRLCSKEMSLVPLCHQVHGPYHACLQCHCFSPAVLSPCVHVAQVSPCLHLMGVCVTSRCVCPAVLLSDPKGKGVTSLLGTTGA